MTHLFWGKYPLNTTQRHEKWSSYLQKDGSIRNHGTVAFRLVRGTVLVCCICVFSIWLTVTDSLYVPNNYLSGVHWDLHAARYRTWWFCKLMDVLLRKCFDGKLTRFRSHSLQLVSLYSPPYWDCGGICHDITTMHYPLTWQMYSLGCVFQFAWIIKYNMYFNASLYKLWQNESSHQCLPQSNRIC